LALRRANHDRRGLAETLNSLGVQAYYAADWDGAWHHYAEALWLLRELPNTLQVALMLANLGEVALKQDDSERAVLLLAASEFLLSDLGSPLAASVRQMLDTAIEHAPTDLTELHASFKPLHLKALLARVMPTDTP
jgi:hypothetical protein